MQLTIKPEWDEIDGMRDQCEAHLISLNLDIEVVQALTMVACELTENAVKYGHYDKEETITISVDVDSSAITVEVTHPVDPMLSENFERFDAMIQWIRGFQDPFEAYLERLREVSSQNLDHAESGLGLVRIAYEGQSVIDFFLEDTHLAVNAVYRR